MTDRRPHPPETGRPSAVLVIVCLSYFMVILDNSIVFTAVPRLQSGMGLSDTGLTWVQDAYTLVFGGLLLLGARAGDLLGRRRVFLAGLVVFGGASLLVGVAPTAWWLVAARAVQGLGAAALAPSSLALLTVTFADGEARSRAVAAYAAVAGIGASAGLVVGGALTDLVSWRAGFFLNVPIGLAMLVVGRRCLPPDVRTDRGRFDLAGAVTATAGVTAIVDAIVHSADAGWTAGGTVVPLVVGVGLLGLLVRIEARAPQPVMPLRLFADRRRTGAYLTRLLYLAAMIGFFFFTTQYLQRVLGLSPVEAGLAFLPMTVVNFAVALAVTRVVVRLGPAATLLAGVAATLAGMTWLSRVGAGSGYLADVALPMVLIGAGQGLAFAPMTSAALAGATGDDAGASSGLVNTVHQLGSALGLGVLTALASAAGGDGTTSREVVVARTAAALSGASLFLLAALAVVAVLIARPGPRPRERPDARTPVAA